MCGPEENKTNRRSFGLVAAATFAQDDIHINLRLLGMIYLRWFDLLQLYQQLTILYQ